MHCASVHKNLALVIPAPVNAPLGCLRFTTASSVQFVAIRINIECVKGCKFSRAKMKLVRYTFVFLVSKEAGRSAQSLVHGCVEWWLVNNWFPVVHQFTAKKGCVRQTQLFDLETCPPFSPLACDSETAPRRH